MDNEKFDQKLQVVNELYQQAEKEIKVTESFSEAISIPSTNQLRHAGAHFLKASAAYDQKEKLQELERARQHCIRAAYDAVETRSVFAIQALNKFKDDYRLLPISKHVPLYDDTLRIADELSDCMLKAKDGQIKEDHFDQISELSSTLILNLKKIENSREVLNSRIRTGRKRAFISWIIAVIGLVASTMGFVDFMWEKAPDKKTPEIQIEIKKLDDISESLSNLQSYVEKQQDRLSSLDSNIEDLKREKKELDEMVATKEQIITSILERYQTAQPKISWHELLSSFSVGVFSSLAVSLFISFRKREKIKT